jgi:tetratricopeptide (TPR) repeat protein
MSVTAEQPDDLAQTDEYHRLLRGLVLSDRFRLHIAVCNIPLAGDRLLALLAADLPRERQAPVRFVTLDPYAAHDFGEALAEDELLTAVLRPLAEPPEENKLHGVVHVLDASRARPAEASAWRWLFGRMNEVRNRIARALGGELILLASPKMELLFVEAAPDFWSIRSSEQLVNASPRPPAPSTSPQGFAPFVDYIRQSESWILNPSPIEAGYDWQQAEEQLRSQSSGATLDVPSLRSALNSFNRLAAQEFSASNLPASRAHLSMVFDIATRLKEAGTDLELGYGLVSNRLLMAAIAAQARDAEALQEHLDEALSILRAELPGIPMIEPRIMIARALAQEGMGRPKKAINTFRRALDLLRTEASDARWATSAGWELASSLVVASDAALTLGHVTSAVRWSEEAVVRADALAEEFSASRPWLSSIWWGIKQHARFVAGRARLADGDIEAGLAWLEEAAESKPSRTADADRLAFEVLAALAEAYASTGDWRRAHHYRERTENMRTALLPNEQAN